jgi:hypothetical protein
MRNPGQKQIIRYLVLGLLVLFVAWQGVQFITYAADQIPAVWTWIGKPPRWRSAAYSSSETFADYIALANETIPKDAPVATLANPDSPWQFSHFNYLQYHFFPREVALCENYACLQAAVNEGAFALIPDIGDYLNSAGDKQPGETLIDFNHKWGILTPEVTPQSETTPLESFSSIKQIGIRLILPGLWLLAVALPGFVLCTVLLPEWRWLSRFFLGITLGLGIVTFIIYGFLLFFQGLSTAIILGSTGIWWLIAILWAFRQSKSSGEDVLPRYRDFRLSMVDVIILAVGLVVAFISIGKSYWGTDGIILWAAKGYGISAFGLSEGVSDWGSWAANYPLQNPISIAIFQYLFGDTVPESKLLPAVFFIALPLVASEFFKTRANWKIYIWTLLLWALSPFVIRQGTIGYANLPLTYYLVVSAIIAVIGMEEEASRHSKSLLALSGILFGIAAWNRPEGSILCVVILALLLIWKRKLWSYWMLYLPVIIFIITWTFTVDLTYLHPSGTENYVSDGILNVLQGNLRWGDAGFISKGFFQAMLSIDRWGLLNAVLLVGLILLLFRRDFPSSTGTIALAGFLVTLAALTVIYLKSYNPMKCDVSCMVSVTMERLALPGIGLMWLGVSDQILFFLKLKKEA